MKVLLADMEDSKFVNKVNYGGGDVLSADTTNVTAVWIHIAGTTPAENDHLRYDLKITATFAGTDNEKVDPAIKCATALAATSAAATTLTSGSETVVGTSTVDAAVSLDAYIWLDGVTPTVYESGTLNISFAVAMHPEA